MDQSESTGAFIRQSCDRLAILDLLDDGLAEANTISKDNATSSGTSTFPDKISKASSGEDPFQLRKRNTADHVWIPRRERRKEGNRIKNEPLCALCQPIFHHSQDLDEFGTGAEQQHHSEQSSFKSAVEASCYICSLLNEKIEALVRSYEHEAEGTQGIQSLFESVNYQVIHEEFEPFIYFTYCERGGHTYPYILSLRLLYTHEIDAALQNTGITNSTRSERNMELVRYWLRQCRNQHKGCGHMDVSGRKLPTRLIEIDSIGGVDTIRLCDGTSLSPSTLYLTLSHCWGREPIYTLLKDNIKHLSETIDRMKLPKVFQDAISMTCHLGFKHLWIDSLCIIQDSREDWLREAPRMGEVYRNATCNIAATGFSDGRNGLFATRDTRLLSPLKVSVDWNGMSPDGETQLRGNYYLLDDGLWTDHVSNAPLNRRAWVTQERILSHSTIHFAAKQLLWECHELIASEAFPNGFNRAISTGGNVKSSFDQTEPKKSYLYWRTVIEAYSKGRLTFHHDKLPAVAGIAREMSRLLPDRYIAGMWEGDLIYSLLWFINSPSDFIYLPSEYCAPTWSWASVDAQIKYLNANRNADMSPQKNDPEEIIYSSIVAVNSTILAGSDDTVADQWSLCIKGPLRRAVKCPMFPGVHHLQRFVLLGWIVNSKKIEISLHLDVPSYSSEEVEETASKDKGNQVKQGPFVRTSDLSLLDPDMSQIFLLPLRSDWEGYYAYRVEMYGLLLNPTGRKRGEFQRIGAFTVGDEEHGKAVLEPLDILEEKFFEEADENGQYTITIV
ncbi:HET-domain-containing protein [Hyaloscypha hepaticicola]|uniref:HET-domain-containing protein n=1 Tax=Hyaloscypha hepaticicola TaxID=2082293 RepID=A0A2J6Q595_9HELO|nr:HET-domain-containing protein [Hyaloscypha hepaticicola]